MISLFKPKFGSRATVGTKRIGLDIGTRALKLVQVEQTKVAWRVGNSLLIPYPCGVAATSEDISQGFVRAVLEDALSNGPWKPSALAGCVFSIDLTPMHTLELPAGTDSEHRQMAEQELAESQGWIPDEQVFDIWHDPVSSPKNAADSQVHVLSVPRSTALMLAQDLLPFGMQCDSIDGLPFAMARAVSLAVDDSDTPVAALDWGASRATFILCQDGRPVFIRRLRECGFSRILEQIENRLGLSAPECARLLESIGMDSSDYRPQTSVARAVSQAALTTFRILADEIRRTLRFLKADAGIEPSRLFLLGGGASIKHIGSRMTELTGLMAENWALPDKAGPVDGETQDAVFATAYAAAVGGAS